MKIQIKNLGALKKAEFSLGDFTIICGFNNTGKTYATYALYGFLYFLHDSFSIKIKEQDLMDLFEDGTVSIDIEQYIKKSKKILSDGCQEYLKQLPKVFAAPPERFKNTEFQVTLEPGDIHPIEQYDTIIRSANVEHFSISKSKDSTDIVVTLLVKKDRLRIPNVILKKFIGNALKNVIFGNLFPKAFIASAERTGAAIFRKELNFARNRLLDEVSQSDKNVDPMELLFKVYQDYAMPVKENVNFTRQLEEIAKDRSFIAEKHPDVLKEFTDILGGEYTVTRNDELYFVPNKSKRIKLSMDESSSAVRSLLDIGFYLRHIARPRDLLMVDEPELNLHPQNQRRVARLFARLVNLGIKVFITTHSDYIIKELNTLIMLNHEKPHLKKIAENEGYKKEELILADQLKVYIAEEAPVKLNGNTRKSRCLTFTPADIDPHDGIEARSFDTTIEDMNRIQEEIVWGEE